MLEECEQAANDRDEAVRKAIKDSACNHFDILGDFIVGRWVMVAEVIDELGDRHLTVLSSVGLEPWEAIGMTAGIGL